MLTQVAAILRTTEKNAPARIVGMKLGPVCGRCGGCGSYSWNAINGSTCFDCRGAGNVKPHTDAEWQATAERAKQAAADGTLDAYIARLDARARSKNGRARAMAAWQKMDKLNGYSGNWRSLVGMPDTNPVVVRNKVGVDLFETLGKLDKGTATDWVEYDRVLTEGLAKLAEITAELEKEKAGD